MFCGEFVFWEFVVLGNSCFGEFVVLGEFVFWGIRCFGGIRVLGGGLVIWGKVFYIHTYILYLLTHFSGFSKRAKIDPRVSTIPVN